MNGDGSMDTCTLSYVKQIASENLLHDSGSANWCSVITWRSGMGREAGGRLWLIHVDVWQKPTQYCKAIILQLKIIF